VYLSFGLDRSEVHAMSNQMTAAAQTAVAAQAAAQEAKDASLAHRDDAEKAAQDAKQTAENTEKSAQDVKDSVADIITALDVKVGAPTAVWHPWQQIPAWALGLASIGIALLLILEEPQNQAEVGWAFAIVGLVLAVVLSFRSEFTFGSIGDEGNREPSDGGDESSGVGGGEPSEAGGGEQPAGDG
jgi:hypothetical protein